jgi:type IV pilus assembly protein PilX
MKKKFLHLAHETGAVLITGLVFLTILTLIVLSALKQSLLEERLVSNAYNQTLLLQASEALLQEIETTILKTPPFDPYQANQFTADCTNGYCNTPIDAGNPRWKDNTTWANAKSRTFANITPFQNISNSPRYIVEILTHPNKVGSFQNICNPGIARITIRATNNNESAVYYQSVNSFYPKDC